MFPYELMIDEIHIPKGNFGNLGNCALPADILEKCITAESDMLTNYTSCVAYLRSAFELFGYEIEYKNQLKSHPSLLHETREEVIRTIMERVMNDKSQNFKKFLKSDLKAHNRDEAKVAHALKKYKELFLGKGDDIMFGKQLTDFSSCFYHLYALLSDKVHNTNATGEHALLSGKALYYVFTAYFDLPDFDEKKLPYASYYPVPTDLYPRLSLPYDREQPIYIKQHSAEESPAFFLLKPSQKGSRQKELKNRRYIEIITRLWQEGIKSPDNMIQIRETLGHGEQEKVVFAFPGRPYEISQDLVKGLSLKEKTDLLQGMIRAVVSLHEMEPPLAHRTLNPASFCLCRQKNSYRSLLLRFDSVKDLTSSETVRMVYEAAQKHQFKRRFLAPEQFWPASDTDYLPSDIFALGRLMNYIYTGNPDGELVEVYSDLTELVHAMTAPNPECRPTIFKVSQTFQEITDRKPAYAICSLKGRRHKVQEDAFLADRSYQTYGPDLKLKEQGKVRYLAVFDGIGGASYADQFSKLAADGLKKRLDTGLLTKEAPDFLLDQAFHELNEAACQFAASKAARDCGTTVAAAILDEDDLYTANLGDSRIYLLHDKKLSQISVDHIDGGQIYQWIGAPTDEFDLEIDQSKVRLSKGDCLLLCTDGLTDTVSDDDIKGILSSSLSNETGLLTAAETLANLALVHGSEDDITILLYRH